MLNAPEPIIFSHVVLVLQNAGTISNVLGHLLQVTPISTAVIIILDMTRKREVIANNPQLDFDDLAKHRRVLFIQKPVKPSRLAVIFDPEKSRELSTDQNQQSAQQIALTQKKVFDEMTRRLGSKNFKVLLVEDNKINQMVSIISVVCATVLISSRSCSSYSNESLSTLKRVSTVYKPLTKCFPSRRTTIRSFWYVFVLQSAPQLRCSTF